MEQVHLVTVTLAIAVPDTHTHWVESYLADAVNEILREEQRRYHQHSCLLDYQLDELDLVPVLSLESPSHYDEGDAFLEER